VAKWGVIVGEAEQDIFGPASGLEKKFFLLVLIFIGVSAFFSIGASLNVVRPLRSLIASSNKIAAGDLSTPVGGLGTDEILQLSKSFDDMRVKLAESLEKIKTHNLELENRVAIRTRQIRESRQKIEQMLKKVITSQEDERRRIARGLHDTVLQDTSAFLIKLDICRVHPELITVEKIDDMRKIALETIDNIHLVIKDLRPSILDDLGLDASIMWLLKNHLQEKGIHYYLDTESPLMGRLPSEVEITIFRILQEAIVNIARHANAENVFVTLDAGVHYLLLIVEDDGDGFDVEELMRHPIENGRGLGIIGMKERASLIGAILQIHSVKGEGTRMCLQVPMIQQVEHV
jgi:signal transduction histidine kinase